MVAAGGRWIVRPKPQHPKALTVSRQSWTVRSAAYPYCRNFWSSSLNPGPSRTLTDSRTLADAGGLRSAAFEPERPLFDAELGQIFIKMRTLLGVSLWDMARAVAAEPTVIANLEAGALDALPAWPELARLVDNYAHLTGVDPQPIMSRLLRTQTMVPRPSAPQRSLSRDSQDHTGPTGQGSSVAAARSSQPYWPIEPQVITTRSYSAPSDRSHARHAAPRSIVDVPALAAAAEIVEAPVKRRGVRQRAGSLGRRLQQAIRPRQVGLLALAVIPFALALAVRFYPGMLYAVVGPLPSVVGAPLLQALDTVVTAMAPVREGLTWIDVGDPRLRRADKLPTISVPTGNLRPRDR